MRRAVDGEGAERAMILARVVFGTVREINYQALNFSFLG